MPPLATVPFPPPLDEGMTEEMWREHVMTPPQSPQAEEQKEVRVTTHGLQDLYAGIGLCLFDNSFSYRGGGQGSI